MNEEYLFDALDRIRLILEEIRDRLPDPNAATDAMPCKHEWFEGRCVHCSQSAKAGVT